MALYLPFMYWPHNTVKHSLSVLQEIRINRHPKKWLSQPIDGFLRNIITEMCAQPGGWKAATAQIRWHEVFEKEGHLPSKHKPLILCHLLHVTTKVCSFMHLNICRLTNVPLCSYSIRWVYIWGHTIAGCLNILKIHSRSGIRCF